MAEEEDLTFTEMMGEEESPEPVHPGPGEEVTEGSTTFVEDSPPTEDFSFFFDLDDDLGDDTHLPPLVDGGLSEGTEGNTEGSERLSGSEGVPVYYDDLGEMYTWDAEEEEWLMAHRASDNEYYDFPDWLLEADQELKSANDGEEDEDTLAQSQTLAENSTTVDDFDMDEPQEAKGGVTEMSKASFRWFERRLLSQQIPKSDENLRRKRLLEKCKMVRRVSKPVVTIMGLTRTSGEDNESDVKRTASKTSLTDDFGPTVTFPDYSEREWAMKNTMDFLTKQSCSSSSGKTYKSSLKAVREEADFRLTLYEKQLQRRRQAIGGAEQAPEITDALKRHAERAVWRAVIDNTKPRYPLPRFILPRHRYLKKVQAQFIGPGSYELGVYEAQVRARKMRMPSLWASCSKRFPKDDSESKDSKSGGAGAPSPLDPWGKWDKAILKHKYPGTYIPFESTPKNWRRDYEPGSRIPPNAYNIKSPLDEFINKTTSIRGPYDCYTPSRAIIPYGYYKSQNDDEHSRLGPGSYEIRTSLVKEMNDPYHYFKGVVPKAERDKMFGFKAAFENPLWPRENGIPPVGEYDVGSGDIGRDKVQYKAPFKIQTGLKQKDVNVELVAPDYYYWGDAKWTVDPKGASLASVFSSRTPQTMTASDFLVRKERNRALNRFCDVAGGDIGKKEEHYAFDVPVKNTYVLEDCSGPCPGGPKVDPFAIPGYGIGSTGSCKVPGKSCCGCG